MLNIYKIKFLKRSLKYSHDTLMLSSFNETPNLMSFEQFISKYSYWQLMIFSTFFSIKQKREVANVVVKDLIGLHLAWRQIKGYPSGGNTTHTNANTSKKTKLLMSFRLEQFNKLFGFKKRNIYPTLIKAEYTNKLWYYVWNLEWLQANRFASRMALLKGKKSIFNPALLAVNQTNGYTRVGKAAKIGKAKRLVNVFTIGVPVFFSRYIYYHHPPHGFPAKLVLWDEVNKKLGKRIRKNSKK